MWTRSLLIVALCIPLLGADTRRRVVLTGGAAATFQILNVANVGDVPSGDDFIAANGAAKGSTFTSTASCDENAQPVPVAGTAEDLRCYSVSSVASGTTITIDLVNATGTDTDMLTCTMVGDDTALECVSTGTGTINAEDTVCIKMNGTSATTNAVGCTWNFTPDTADEFIALGGMTSPSNSATRYTTLNGVYTAETDAQQAEAAWPTGGNFTKLCAYTATDPDPAGSSDYTVTLLEDEVATDMVVTLNDTNCSSTYPCVVCDTGNEAVVEGSDMQVRVVPTGTPNVVEIMHGAVFEPTTAGEFVMSVATDATWPTAASNIPLMGGDPALSPGQNEPPTGAWTIKKLCAQFENGQSLSGGTCTADVEIDAVLTRTGGGEPDISVQMDPGENLQCATATVNVAAGEEVVFEVSCSSPTGAQPYSVSLVGEE